MRSVTKTYDVLDAFDYARYRNESNLKTTATGFPAFHIEGNQLYQIVNNDGNVSISDTPVTTVDWQDELLNLSDR